MSQIISMGLLSEVFGKKVYRYQTIDDSNNIILHFDQERYLSDSKEVNIHELAHKCEVNLYVRYGYRIITWFDEITSYSEIYNCKGFETHELGMKVHKMDEQCPIVEMKIKACQWVLDNKDNS